MEVEETRLPGIGLRHDFVTSKGRRVGVISQRNGMRKLVVYDRDDPDACRDSVSLTAEEGEMLAELLGAPKVVERLARLREQVESLATEGLRLDAGSPYVDRTLADTRIRTRTGASVVAVIRDRDVTPSPAPNFRFRAGDKIIVVGTDEGLEGVERILVDG